MTNQPETKYGPRHYDVLLAHILRSPILAELALRRLEGHHLNDKRVGGSPFHGITFKIIKDYYVEHNTVPDRAVLVTEVNRYIQKYFGANARAAKSLQGRLELFLTFMGLVDTRSEPLARKLIEYIAEECVIRPELDRILEEAGATPALKELGDRILALEEQRVSFTGGKSVTGILDLALENVGERMTTGVPWLDARFANGAGPVSGCTMAIIAPQGCGKTSMGINIAVQQALIKRHALLVLVEEGLTLSMRAKIMGCALNIHYELIANAPGNTFSEKVRHALESGGKTSLADKDLNRKRMVNLEEHLHILDIAREAGNLDKIYAEISRLESVGQKPVYVYVDWAGILATKMMAESGRTNKEQELKRVSYTLNEYSQRFDNIVSVSQQMAAANVGRGPFAVNDQYCAADCKGFCEPMKYSFVINPKCPNNKVSLFIVAKSRDDAPPENLVVKLQGQFPRFENVTDNFSLTNFRYKRKSMGAPKVPVEA